MMDYPIDSILAVAIAFLLFILISIGIILVLWIAMPFSVFGVKGLLRKSIEEQEKTNRLLSDLVETLKLKEKTPPAEKSSGEGAEYGSPRTRSIHRGAFRPLPRPYPRQRSYRHSSSRYPAQRSTLQRTPSQRRWPLR